MTANPFHYSLLHWSDPDVVGHQSGWMSTAYLDAVKAMDGLLGQIFSMVEDSNKPFSGKTSIVLTSDHGGIEKGHGDKTLPEVYTIPLYAWGPEVMGGADLYQLNPTSRTNPGTSRLDNTVVPQPIRHGDAVNLALDFLGLGAIPGSLFNVQQDLSVRGAPLASLIDPQDGGANDMDPASGSVKVNNAQPVFSVKLSAAGLGVNDASVTASTVRMVKNGVSFTGYTFGYDGTTDTIALTPTSGSFGTGSYEIHLSADSDKISDLDGYVMAATTLRINIDPSLVVEQTVSFQQGVNGYWGTVDTQFSENAPDTSFATATSLNVDNDEPQTSGKDNQVLLRFDNLFGSDAGQIPAGATISSATLELQITDTGNSINLHRMLKTWSATDTWSTFGGVQADGIEALSTFDVSTGEIGATGKRSIDVTASLVAWLANPAGNLGWVLLPTGSNGVDFYFSEGATPPRLVVTYTYSDSPTAVFQQGIDTYIDSNYPDTSYGGVSSLNVDTSDPGFQQAIIRFSDIFGSGTGQIPAGSTISSATLELNVTNPGNTVNIHRTLKPWLATDTWNTLVSGVQFDDIEASSNIEVSFTPSTTGLYRLNVTGSLRAWSADPTKNLGWVLTPTGSDGVDIDSFEGAIKPRLVVIYEDLASAPTATADAYSIDEDTTLTVSAPGVLGNDTDPDNDPLTAVLVDGPSNGTLTFSADGSFIYTPKPNFNGTDSFTYRAFDGISYSSPTTVTITVNGVNDAPVAVDDSFSGDEDTTISGNVLDNDTDVDGDALTATLVTGPTSGTLELNADGTFAYTPTLNFHGTDRFTYRVSDGFLTSEATVTLTINPVNDAPVAANDTYATTEDTALTVAAAGVLANDTDVDGNALTAVLVSGPGNGSLTLNPDGSFTYTPSLNFYGTDTFTYQASDGSAFSNVAMVTLNVTAVNDAPVAVDDSYSVDENDSLTIAAPGVLANDSDPENDSLTVSFFSPPTHGTLVVNDDGSFVYAPAKDYHGPDSFTYIAYDGALHSNVATVRIDVKRTNIDPVAANDEYITGEDTPLIMSAPGVLGNDADPDGDPLIAVVVAGPSNGTLTLNANGSFIYNPSPNFYGTDSFTYQAIDIIGASSNVATVTITVDPVNDAPVAANDDYTTNEDVALVVTAPGVLSNDTDVDGDALTAALVTGPTNGTLTLNLDGSFTYMPNANFNGLDGFAYQASDGKGGVATATVTLNVAAVNDAPVAVDDIYNGDEDTTISGNVLTNDTDVDGDVLTATVVNGPMNGTLTWNPDRTFTYTPNANFNGTDSFTYTANDGQADSNVATVTITVHPVNDAPVAMDDSASVLEGSTLNGVSVLRNDIDVDGDVLTAELATWPTHGTLDFEPDGTYTYTPAAGFTGTDIFTYIARDTHGAVSNPPATVTLTVIPLGTDDFAISESTTFGTADGLSGASSSDNIYETMCAFRQPHL